MKEKVTVRIGGMAVGCGQVTLQTFALGSCVGLCLYDKHSGVGGMAHVFLPDSRGNAHPDELGRFADTAVPHLVRKLLQAGASRRHLRAHLFGGAKMFPFGDKSNWVDIGALNVEAVTHALELQSIPVVERQVGGSKARTLYFDLDKGVPVVAAPGMRGK